MQHCYTFGYFIHSVLNLIYVVEKGSMLYYKYYLSLPFAFYLI